MHRRPGCRPWWVDVPHSSWFIACGFSVDLGNFKCQCCLPRRSGHYTVRLELGRKVTNVVALRVLVLCVIVPKNLDIVDASSCT